MAAVVICFVTRHLDNKGGALVTFCSRTRLCRMATSFHNLSHTAQSSRDVESTFKIFYESRNNASRGYLE